MLIFIKQSIAQHEIRRDAPFVLREDADVCIVLRRGRKKVLAKAAGNVREKIAGAVEVPGSRGVGQIDER